MSKVNAAPAAPDEIKDFTPLFEHAKKTADSLGHPHTLTQKEWNTSKPSHTSAAIIARFNTWGIDAESREYDRRYDIMSAIVTECLDKLEAAKVFETFDCSRDQLDSAISGYLTGVF